MAACASVGVGEDECDEGRLVAVLVGLKTIVNEFAAYDRLRTYQVGPYCSLKREKVNSRHSSRLN